MPRYDHIFRHEMWRYLRNHRACDLFSARESIFTDSHVINSREDFNFLSHNVYHMMLDQMYLLMHFNSLSFHLERFK